jgi:hypothetical protein
MNRLAIIVTVAASLLFLSVDPLASAASQERQPTPDVESVNTANERFVAAIALRDIHRSSQHNDRGRVGGR